MRIRIGWRYLISAPLLFLAACDASPEETAVDYTNCRYDKPEAIFFDGLPEISEHQFHTTDKGSEETFNLAGAIRVSILQSGCDYRTQVFIFELDERTAVADTEAAVRQITQLFQALSRFGPEYHIFRVWAQAIKEARPPLQAGETMQLAEGFWVKLDQKKNSGNTILMLTLSEKE